MIFLFKKKFKMSLIIPEQAGTREVADYKDSFNQSHLSNIKSMFENPKEKKEPETKKPIQVKEEVDSQICKPETANVPSERAPGTVVSVAGEREVADYVPSVSLQAAKSLFCKEKPTEYVPKNKFCSDKTIKLSNPSMITNKKYNIKVKHTFDGFGTPIGPATKAATNTKARFGSKKITEETQASEPQKMQLEAKEEEETDKDIVINKSKLEKELNEVSEITDYVEMNVDADENNNDDDDNEIECNEQNSELTPDNTSLNEDALQSATLNSQVSELPVEQIPTKESNQLLPNQIESEESDNELYQEETKPESEGHNNDIRREEDQLKDEEEEVVIELNSTTTNNAEIISLEASNVAIQENDLVQSSLQDIQLKIESSNENLTEKAQSYQEDEPLPQNSVATCQDFEMDREGKEEEESEIEVNLPSTTANSIPNPPELDDKISNLTGSNANIHEYQQLDHKSDDEQDYQQFIGAKTNQTCVGYGISENDQTISEDYQSEEWAEKDATDKLLNQNQNLQASTEEIVDQAILSASLEVESTNHDSNSTINEPLVDSTSNISDNTNFTVAPEDKEIEPSLLNFEASRSSFLTESENGYH